MISSSRSRPPRTSTRTSPQRSRYSTHISTAQSEPTRSTSTRTPVFGRIEFPYPTGRASDALDLRALALALPRCRLVTCDAFMADLVRRSGLHVRFHSELFTSRRHDVLRLRERLERLEPTSS